MFAFQSAAVLGQGPPVLNAPDHFPTGIPALDTLLGGGIARGQVHEVFGEADSAKTTLAYQLVASAQSRGVFPVFVDPSRVWRPAYSKACGVDPFNLMIVRPVCAEESMEIVRTFLGEGAFVVIDDSSVLPSEGEGFEDVPGGFGSGPRTSRAVPCLYSRDLGDFRARCRLHGGGLVVINQTRRFGLTRSERVSTTNRALLYYSHTRLQTETGPPLTRAGLHVGFRGAVRVVKSADLQVIGKTAPFRLRNGLGFVP